MIGGALIAAGLSTNAIFYVLGALAVVGVVLTLLVPQPKRELHTTTIEPSPAAEAASA